ncbi:hypothetical protein R3P38DRAFT_2842330 [Favolaschia claudopus]|uniref:N-acetyltransferase domain-containing protein n=1 Tax=Favolaschia claudopus TaxID=2862362 RepID=A0AAW0E1J8_9AGAR
MNTQNMVNLDTLALAIKAKNHPEYPGIIKRIFVQVQCPQLGNIGSLEAWRISRSQCAGSFLEIMDVDEETHQFSIALFDNDGRLLPELVNPGHRSGTGCWGREMDSGKLLYILDFTIDEAHRGQGIGTWALSKFLESQHVKATDTVACWPTPVGINDKELWHATRDRQIAFFRKNHFRRIGRTSFFGFSPRSDHPSRSIPIDADADALGSNFNAGTDISPQGLNIQYPLHSAIIHVRSAEVTPIIQSFYDQNPDSIHQPDDMGFTPILVAVASHNLVAVRKLLGWDLSADLRSRANAKGITPLELAEGGMRSGRQFAETFLEWNGYSDDELTMCYYLKQGLGEDIGASLTEYIAKSKLGY